MKPPKVYVWNILIAIDQFLNALTFGAPDETMSSRIGRNKDKNRLAWVLAKFLDWIDPNHVEDSIEFKPDGEPDPHHLKGFRK